jgi:hypothetical protein
MIYWRVAIVQKEKSRVRREAVETREREVETMHIHSSWTGLTPKSAVWDWWDVRHGNLSVPCPGRVPRLNLRESSAKGYQVAIRYCSPDSIDTLFVRRRRRGLMRRRRESVGVRREGSFDE